MPRYRTAQELFTAVGAVRVHVYRNLNQPGRTYSVRDAATGLVIAHTETALLVDATFRVSDAGRNRVRLEQRRHVHAWVIGVLATPADDDEGSDATPASVGYYNPYRTETFIDVDTRQPLTAATLVLLDGSGVRYRP